jgi:hypothetical protein
MAFTKLVAAFPGMELVTEEIEWTQSTLVRGPEELRLRTRDRRDYQPRRRISRQVRPNEGAVGKNLYTQQEACHWEP